MMKTHMSILLMLSIIMFFSCKNHTLSKSDLDWQPYKENDILIFESNKGEIDTVNIKEIIAYNNADDPLAIFPDKVQTLFVNGKKNILKLKADKSGSSIFFTLRLGEGYMKYPCSIIAIDEFENSMTSNDNFGKFSNCYSIKAEESCDNMKDRSFDLRYIYWSKEFGYLGLRFKDNYIWELKKLIRNNKNILNK